MMEYVITDMSVRQEHDVMPAMSGSVRIPSDMYIELTLLVTENDGTILSFENVEDALKDCSKFNGHRFSKDMIETALQKTYPEYFI
jgi:hypothetical protein